MDPYRFLLSARLIPVADRLFALLGNLAKLVAIEPPNSYRPEQHYMRGPGPKWREKHAPPAGR